VLYEEITKPLTSTAPVPPVNNSDYPEDREDANEEVGPFFDGSLSINEAISQILDLPNVQVPIDVYNSDDEEEVDGYGCLGCPDCPDL
jgi:hypothetical protein